VPERQLLDEHEPTVGDDASHGWNYDCLPVASRLDTIFIGPASRTVDRGVVFDEYDFPNYKTIDSIVTSSGIGTSAWFKDPDGNTIALFQPA
jgi:hypothetical protein